MVCSDAMEMETQPVTSQNTNPRRIDLAGILFIGGFVIVGLLRLWYCFQVPWHTTDLLRNLGYGREFWNLGFSIYDHTPQDFSPHPGQFLWGGHYYTYPAYTALFFALIAPLSPGLIAGKLWLTLLDGINAVCIGKMTKDRTLALLYWANPIGVWHISHEGQFESFVGFWMILAIWLLWRKNPWGFFLFGVAIQTKFFPVFLAPVFLFDSVRVPWRIWAKRIGLFALSFLPTVLVLTGSEYLHRFLQPGYIPGINYIAWGVADYGHFPYQPWWLILTNAATSIGVLILIIWLAYRNGTVVDYSPCFLFLFSLKTIPLAQFWYMQIFPAFALTVRNVVHRRLLFLACMAMAARSILSILGLRFAYMNPPEILSLLQACLWRIP